MEGAIRHGFREAAFTAAALLLFQSVQGSEGLESGAPGLESPPSTQDIASPVQPQPPRPFRRLKRALVRRLTRTITPLLNYSRWHVGRLLPSLNHLPSHLARRDHDDYMPPFQWIPRGWTTFDWGKPELVAGNQKNFEGAAPKPIGERGSFQLASYPDLPIPLCWLPMYFAFTLPNGVHFRLGARWDDVDAYVVAPSIAIKRHVE